jgi:hypothetical protein
MRRLIRTKKLLWQFACVVPFGAATVGHASEKPGYPFPQHIDQLTITKHSFEEIYGWGDQLFHAEFNSLDGVGANLSSDPPGGLIQKRFTRSPRADLPGWLLNPRHPDGPQSQNCAECHEGKTTNTMVEDRDPLRLGDISKWIARKATNISGMGALQLLAEQSSREIQSQKNGAIAAAKKSGAPVTVNLVTSNGIHYGAVTALADGSLDGSHVEGLDTRDLPIIQMKGYNINAFHLKSIVPFAREFGAATDTTLGLQSPERVPEWEDGDNDGVVGELSVGDVTALTMFLVGQQRPVTKLELDKYVGGKYRLGAEEKASIARGEAKFAQIGCASCHTPRLHLKDPTFREPSSTEGFNFPVFWINHIDPATLEIHGTDPKPYGYDPAHPVTFNLTQNPVWERTCRRLHLKSQRFGANQDCFLQFESDGAGGAYIDLYGDQKRHNMGPLLAEAIDEFGVPAAVWRTKELWGVGSVGPWLHDGRATTLTEAVLFHGGEGQASRDKFAALPDSGKDDVLNFMRNLVIYTPKFHSDDDDGYGGDTHHDEGR